MKANKIFCALVLMALPLTLVAQEEQTDWGKVHGGIESNNAFYKKDPNQPDEKRYGTNTYLNLKYSLKGFNLGLQGEIFEPPMRGYPANGTLNDLKGTALTQYYLNYANEKIDITLGSFYQQFGSGLIFRAFEERSLGINNSLRGINIKYSPLDWINLKVMGGQPRRYLHYADALMYGTDAEFIISRLWNKEATYDITLGGAYVGRHNTKEFEFSVDPTDINLFSVRSGFNNNLFNFGVEYTAKGHSQTYAETGLFENQSGDALLINMDFTSNDFGFSGVFRRIEHMDFRVDGKPALPYISMNYIPALTKQHKYTLPALYPHVANLEGEIGGQLDLFWNLHADWLGNSPLKIALNASHYNSLGANTNMTMPFFGQDGKSLFSEVSLELGKSFNRNVIANLGFYFQRIYHDNKQNKSFVSVADVLWRFTRKASIRTELQHMTTEMDEKKWIFGLMEFGFAPNWMVFASDMYSYGAEKKEHYYNMGASFTYESLKLTASYGRTRGGTQCVGGICRYVPEYTGALVGLTYVF